MGGEAEGIGLRLVSAGLDDRVDAHGVRRTLSDGHADSSGDLRQWSADRKQWDAHRAPPEQLGTIPGVCPAGRNRPQRRNRIAIRLQSAAGSGGLGPVVAGRDIAIRHEAYVDLLRFVVGPAIISTTIVVLGLVSLMLWLRRRETAYGLFGAAAILWGLHTGLAMLNPAW